MKLAWATLFSLLSMACSAEVGVEGGAGGSGGGGGAGDGAGGTGGDDSCGDFAGCEPADCPAEVPADLSTCTLADGTHCQYPLGDHCGAEYSCEPVYPEAGAPSHWVYQGEYDDGTIAGCLYDCAPASCNQGDVELGNTCPEGMFCYEVTFIDDPCQTIVFCGSTLTPEHECVGLVEEGASCPHPDVSCMQEAATPNCYDSFECTGGSWDLVGTQCAE